MQERHPRASSAFNGSPKMHSAARLGSGQSVMDHDGSM